MIDLEAAAEALNSEPVVSPSPADAIWQAGRRRRRRIRRWRIGSGAVCTSIAVAVALVLAANPTTERVVVEATQEPDPTRVAKETAERYADIYLDRLVLPDGAKPYLGAPPQLLLKAFATPGTPNLVDHHRFWRVPHNTGVTVRFLRSHPPAGMTGPEMSGTGSTGSQITVESLTYGTTPATSSLLPTTIAELQVQVSVTADGTGSWVRADAQVLWRPERDPTTFLPDDIHAITISRKPNRQPDSNPGAGRVQITDMKAVTELVDAFNELTVAVPGEDHGCGMTPSYTLEFRSRASAAPELTATIYCRYVQVTINGHDAATLAKSAALSQPVAAIFGDQPPGTSQGTPSVSAADLRKFRDAAADAPYWDTVKWIPPSSVQQAVGNTSAVVVGTVRSARVDQPRADDLIPFEGAPTLYHLEVIVDIDDTRVVAGQVEGNVVQARIPVLSGPAEGLAAAGRAAADRIVAAAPENAVGVFLISRTSGTAKPVAFQSSTGELVAFYSSMDEAVAPLDIERLAEELAAAVPRTGIAGSETTQLLGPEERELPAHLALGRRTIPPAGLEEWEGLPVIAAPTDGEGPTTCSHAHGERVLRFEMPEAVVVGVYGSDEAPSACMYRSDGAEVTECEQGISFYAREPTEYQLSLCRPNRLPSSGIVWLAWADVPDGASVLLQYRGAYWLAYSVTGESIVPISGHNANPFDAGKWLNRLVFINEAGDVVKDAQILYEVVS